MFHANTEETKTFTVRCAPGLAQRATELARRRGLGRSTMIVRILEAMALEEDAGADVPAVAVGPGMEGTNEQQPA